MRSTPLLNSIRRYRLLHEPPLTQRELALGVRVLQTLISRYERGASVPSLYRAFQIAVVLRMPVEKLFVGLYERASDSVARNRLPQRAVDISPTRVWMNGGKGGDKPVVKSRVDDAPPPSRTLPPPRA